MLACLVLAMASPRVYAQGCVASPGSPMCSLMPGGHATESSLLNRFSASVAFRWYESARHFGGRNPATGQWLNGDEENTGRSRANQQMINKVGLINIAVGYDITARWNASLDLPYIIADRSSVFEHSDGQRHSMHARGVGDLRLVTEYWLLDPHQHRSGNIALGIGVKAPTGDDSVTDTSFRGAGPVERPVDQSIQPGDGGWGLILQVRAYQKIYQHLSAYAQGFYLLSPEEQNDTQRVMGDVGPVGPMTYNSIGDQYFGRAGLNYVIWPARGLTLSFGGRVEGVPVWDAVGGSLGYRQPGYTVSVEPGLTWAGHRNTLSLLAPVAVYRNRLRSAAEIEMGRRGGDASFADFSIMASFTHHF